VPAMNYERVARLYDCYVRTDIDVSFFLGEVEKAGGPVLELTAGTGRVSIPLLEAGVDLTCVDSSAAMLEVFREKLREKGLLARSIQADMCELSLGRQFDLIFIPFNSFAEITDPAQQGQALSRIHDHLTEEGRFICTLHNPPVRLKKADGQERLLGHFPLPDGRGVLSLSSTERYDATTGLVTGTQFYRIADEQGRVLSEDTLDICFAVHHRGSFEALAADAGFSVVHLYGDYSYSPFEPDTSPFMIWVLSKTTTS
jgi:SAM-dependent methyltransferase